MGKDKEARRERSRSRDKAKKKDSGEGRSKHAEAKAPAKEKSSRADGKAARSGDGKADAKAKDGKSAKAKTSDTKESKAKDSKEKKASKEVKEDRREAKQSRAREPRDGKDRDGKSGREKPAKEPKAAKEESEAPVSEEEPAEDAKARDREEATEGRQRRVVEAFAEAAAEAPAEPTPEKGRKRPGAAGASDDDCAASRSPSYSSSSSGRRKRRREREASRGVGGFSTGLGGSEVSLYGPSSLMPMGPVGEKVAGLLQNPNALAFEVARLKQAAEAASMKPKAEKPEEKETVLKMPKRLQECILDPANRDLLLARTGLVSVRLNEDACVVLKASSSKGLQKALGQLRRVAYHCQWGCTPGKVASLLTEKPAGQVSHTMVVRLAATSSRLQSFEARLTQKVRKLRIGTQAGACQLVVEGVPGLSRKHCTITFEPDKGACYVQDLSTNGTYFNGKRLPRPPYKNPQDARVRVFHGDELFFRLRSDDAEELGYVINLLELS